METSLSSSNVFNSCKSFKIDNFESINKIEILEDIEILQMLKILKFLNKLIILKVLKILEKLNKIFSLDMYEQKSLIVRSNGQHDLPVSGRKSHSEIFSLFQTSCLGGRIETMISRNYRKGIQLHNM